jgi:hypothetical protein
VICTREMEPSKNPVSLFATPSSDRTCDAPITIGSILPATVSGTSPVAIVFPFRKRRLTSGPQEYEKVKLSPVSLPPP